MERKRGVFFSIDALIAIAIVLSVLLIAFPIIKYSGPKTEIHRDIITTLSSLKIGDMNSNYVRSLISQGIIKDTNKSVLEQIGEFYVTDQSQASALANEALSSLNTEKNVGLWFGNTLLASKNSTPYDSTKDVEVARQLISGIKEGESLSGFSARAFLKSSLRTQYYYFGGYVGDGNISARIEYSGNITSAEIEMAISGPFQVYVNNAPAGSFSQSQSELVPSNYSIPITNFQSGVNTIEIKGNNLHITGGFIKVTYQTDASFSQPAKYYFSGINGLINIYDGFYVPGQLDSLSASLHLKTNYTTFLIIGNKTVYNGTTLGLEQTISLSNSQLSSLLNYASLVNKTVPIRIGLENSSLAYNPDSQLDLVSVTDISGSMDFVCLGNPSISCCSTQYNYPTCHGRCTDTALSCITCGGTSNGDPIGKAKQANNILIQSILQTNITIDDAQIAQPNIITPGQIHEAGTNKNRVGVIGYNSNVQEKNVYNLSKISAEAYNSSIFPNSPVCWAYIYPKDANGNYIWTGLKYTVNQWDATAGTCISCGIRRAKNELIANSNSSRTRVMVVMSDGKATETISGSSNQAQAKAEAISEACNAYNNYGIIVHAVGFGSSADEDTLQNIANCGHGNYYYANINEIVSVYSQIANTILQASYREQTLNASSTFNTILYPDSYIQFSSPEQINPYGLIITTENKFTNSTSGSFSVPPNSTIIETKVTSYSGSKWTNKLKINGNPVFTLQNYGSDYIKLGDPYNLNIPSSLVNSSNTVTIETATSPTNTSIGSSSDKIILTIAKDISAYSPISANKNGCNWNIQFEDNTNISISVPQNYSGLEQCSFSPTSQQYDSNDAIQKAVKDLLTLLDLNSNNKIDIKFTEQDLQIETSEISGIPFTWSTEVQARTWSR